MKKSLFTLMLLSSLLASAQYSWTQKADYPGAARSSAVGFVVGNNAYIGTGTDDAIFFKNFWKYDPALDTFTPITNYPGAARREAVAFAIGNKGYVGTGCCGAMADFYSYNTGTNTWAAIASFPQPTMTAIAFAIGDKGYVGLGDDGGASFSKKIYEYDTTANTWTQKANFPGAGRTDALGFSMNGKGYVAIGDDGTGPFLKDLWEYDPQSDSWTQKTNFPGGPRSTAVGFAIPSLGKLYIGTGDDNANLHADFWEWDSSTDTWAPVTNFPGAAQTDETGFCIGNEGYVVLGQVGQPPESKELWKWGTSVSVKEVGHSAAMTVYPNPAIGETEVKIRTGLKDVVVSFINSYGEIVMEQKNVNDNRIILSCSALSPGLYFVSLTSGGKLISTEKLVILR